MSNHNRDDEFCLQCHWEAFKMTGNNPMLSSGFNGQNPWDYPYVDDNSHSHVSCGLDETCCDADDCSVQCSSVCDGFVGCDASTACSESHCDEVECESVSPVCFDKNCISENRDGGEQDLAGLLGQDEPFNWEETSFLPSTEPTTFDSINSYEKFDDYTNTSAFPLPANNLPSQSMADAAANPDFSSLGFHSSTKGSNTNFSNHAYTGQNDFDAEVYDILGMKHNFGGCPHHPQGGSTFPNQHDSDEFYRFASEVSQPQCQAQHQHMDSCFSVPMNPRLYQPQGNVHHSHCPNHYSVSSVSSTPLHSTPMETPPPQRNEFSSPLTSPDYAPPDNAPVICRWASKKDGSTSICGARLCGPAALQEHLISKHMGTVDGSRGHGYYCRWEGCSRPNEPFSQKSKLQGHFLTHSNYKNFACATCGKSFARQATLERHERSHRGDKPYMCKQCGKSFTDSSELKTHMRTHTGEKPFKCKYPGCGFETGDSSNMSSHKLTHGERRHKCPAPGCSKSFTRPDQLKRHIKSTHNKQEVPSSTLTSPSVQQIPLPSFETTF